MKETVTTDPPAALDGIPLLRDLDEPDSSRGDGPPVDGDPPPGSAPASAVSPPRSSAEPAHPCRSAELDWSQVVELRRRTSEAITEEAAHQQRATGRRPDRRRPAPDGPGHHPAGGR